jgi:hypothetical protein
MLPYQRIRFTSKLNPDEIRNALSILVAKPDWNVNLDKVINNRILEGRISDKSFTIIMGRYGLTYGMTSLLPVMKGRIRKDGVQGSEVDVIIRPLKTGIFILGFFYALVGLGLFFSIAKGLPQVFIVCCIFLTVTYYSLTAKFNREAKVYRDIINNYLK